MRNSFTRIKPWLGIILLAAASAHAQNPQLRPPSPSTATGISSDSAASMPLPGRDDKDPRYDTLPEPAAGSASGVSTPDKGPRTKFKDKPYKSSKSKRAAPSTSINGEPSDPHQVNGRATGGPDNKASPPEPGGRGTGLSR